MSLLDFQRALSELVMSPQFRRQVAAEPDAALAPFDLSERDRQRLATIAHDDRVKAGTIIHRSFRLATLSNTLPRTCRALGGEGVRELATAYWRDNLPRNYFYAQEAARFGAFALEHLRNGETRYRYLPEVLHAELAMLELGFGVPWSAEPDLGLAPGMPLRLDPRCRIVRFEHDPDVLLPALKAGLPPDLPEEEHYLLVASAGTAGTTLRQLGATEGRALHAIAAAADGAELEPDPEMVSELIAAGYVRAVPAD